MCAAAKIAPHSAEQFLQKHNKLLAASGHFLVSVYEATMPCIFHVPASTVNKTPDGALSVYFVCSSRAHASQQQQKTIA